MPARSAPYGARRPRPWERAPPVATRLAFTGAHTRTHARTHARTRAPLQLSRRWGVRHPASTTERARFLFPPARPHVCVCVCVHASPPPPPPPDLPSSLCTDVPFLSARAKSVSAFCTTSVLVAAAAPAPAGRAAAQTTKRRRQRTPRRPADVSGGAGAVPGVGSARVRAAAMARTRQGSAAHPPARRAPRAARQAGQASTPKGPCV